MYVCAHESAQQGVPRRHPETKFDGTRMQAHKAGGTITLYAGDGEDWTGRFPLLTAALRALPCESAVVDGELAHEDSFEAFDWGPQRRPEGGLVLWAFDLMLLDDEDLRARPLGYRQRILQQLVERSAIDRLHFSEHFMNGDSLLAECDKRGLQGVVAKRAASVYRSGPSTAWLLVQCPAWLETRKNRGEHDDDGR